MLFKYVYGREAYRVNDDNPHRNKKAKFEHFPGKSVFAYLSHGIFSAKKEWSLSCDKTVWLKPASSERQYIQLDKGKYIKSHVLYTSAQRDA